MATRSSNDLTAVLKKLIISLTSDQIHRLANRFHIALPTHNNEGSTSSVEDDLLHGLETKAGVRMSEESLDGFIDALKEVNIPCNIIVEFKKRHYEESTEKTLFGDEDSDLSYSRESISSFPEPTSCQSGQGDGASLGILMLSSHSERSEENLATTKPPKLGSSDESDSSSDEGRDSPDEDDVKSIQATGKDRKFLLKVKEVARRSNDTKTQVGAVLVSPEWEVIGEGYNKILRDDLPRKTKAKKSEDTKYLYSTHAADEAIMDALKKGKPTKDAVLYTTSYPSSRDGVRIYRAGIKEVVYMKKHQKWKERYNLKATERLFEGEVNTRKLHL